MVINGETYKSDLIIYPDGHVEDSWWRRSGHRLSADDIEGLVESAPEVIIVGTGANGMLKPALNLADRLLEEGIELIPLPNRRAVGRFNELSSQKRVGACFHLTC